jgi:ATP/maltotriose-dependent transcriptional regulator MalT
VDEPFVGRHVELAELERQFALTAAGHGRVVVLSGPAGVGKTGLIRKCLSAWSEKSSTLLISGDETEAVMSGGLLGQLGHRTSRTTTELAAVLADGRADPLTVGSALLTFLRERAATAPLVLVIDDAQWADELSLQALTFALRRLRDAPVMCLIATLSDAPVSLPAGLTRVVAERGVRLEVTGLDAHEVAELAELAGAGRLPLRAAERLREHAAGIPLHVRELLHDLPPATLRTPAMTLPAPRSLQTLVVSRLAACSSDTEALVVAAAVLGPECDLAEAAELAGLRDPLPALQEAITHRFLIEPSTTGRRRCAFPHAIFRTAVYEGVGLSRRAALHRGAAGLTSGVAALSHRAAGCVGADDQLAADLAAQAAAERAAGQLLEAAEHLLMAARVADAPQSADNWLLDAVALLIDHGDAARARGYVGQVASTAPSARRSLLLGRLDLLVGACDRAEHQISGAWTAVLAASVPPGLEETREAAAKAACELALLFIAQQRNKDAMSWAQRSATTAVSAFTRACSRSVQAVTLALAGQARPARALLEAELQQCADPAARSLLQAGLATTLLYADDLPGAGARIAQAITAQGDARLPLTHLLQASMMRVVLCYRNGNWDQGVAESERLIRLIDDLEQGWLLGPAHVSAVYIAAGRGQWQSAAGHLDAASRRLGTAVPSVALTDARMAVAVARDDPQAVVAAAEELVGDESLLSDMDPGRLGFWPAYAQALVRLGRIRDGDRVLGQYERRARACDRRSALAAAGRARGALCCAAQDTDGALAALAASLADLDGLGMPMEEATTRFERGRLLRRAGQRRAAVRDLSIARSLFAGLGAEPYVRRCDQEMGAELPGLAISVRTPLTARQLSVATAAAEGKSNREIAADLYISVKTVEFHLGQILARLDLDSRAEIAGALAAFAQVPAAGQ